MLNCQIFSSLEFVPIVDMRNINRLLSIHAVFSAVIMIVPTGCNVKHCAGVFGVIAAIVGNSSKARKGITGKPVEMRIEFEKIEIGLFNLLITADTITSKI